MSSKNNFLKNLYQNNEYFKIRAGKDYDKLLEAVDEADPDFCEIITDRRANEFIKNYSTQEMLNRIERKNNGLPPVPMTPNPYKKLEIRNKLGMATPQQNLSSGKFGSRNGKKAPYGVQSVNVNRYRNKRQRYSETGDRSQGGNLKKSVIDGRTKKERRNQPKGDRLIAISDEFYLKPHHFASYSSKTVNPFAFRKENLKFGIDGKKKNNLKEKPIKYLHRSMKDVTPEESKAWMQKMKSKDPRISFKEENEYSKKRLGNDYYEPEERYGKCTVSRPYDGSAKKYLSVSSNSAKRKGVGSMEQDSYKEYTRQYKYPKSKNIQIAKRNII